MTGFVTNIESKTEENDYFRRVLFTAPHSQLVVMSLKPGEDIGAEVHHGDQFIRIEEGEAIVTLDDEKHDVADGFAIVIPAGTQHNIENTSKDEDLKLYTIYSPPQHEDGTIHKTKQDAEEEE
jgi:mannose-6-phosphate isomerase-like protein (cupin superfamily)